MQKPKAGQTRSDFINLEHCVNSNYTLSINRLVKKWELSSTDNSNKVLSKQDGCIHKNVEKGSFTL